MLLTDEEIRRIQDRLILATPGDWVAGKNYYSGYGIFVERDGEGITEVARSHTHHEDENPQCPCNIYNHGCIKNKADADLIAHAKEDLTRLVALVYHLKGQVADLHRENILLKEPK